MPISRDLSGRLASLPTVTQEDSVGEIDNPALRAVAEDVANAVKYSVTAVAADPDLEVRDDSLEAEFKQTFRSLATSKGRGAAMAENARGQAVELLKADKTAQSMMFGRHAALIDSGPAFARQGFDRALEAVEGVDIRLEDLGLRAPAVTVPLNKLQKTGDGLLLPNIELPTGFEDADFESISNVGTQQAIGDGVFDFDSFEEIFGSSYEGDPWEDQFEAGSDFEAAEVSRLELKVRRVLCEDETNPEFWGNDEIALGGISIDEDGDTAKINERYVGGGFKDGRSKTLNWDYHWFNLNERSYWPKKYGVSLILAEKDHGGFSGFLSKAWEKVRGAVLAAIKKAAAKAGMALAAWLGLASIGPIIGKILGEVAAWVIGKLIEWFIKLFKDDIFPPRTIWVNLPSKSARWRYSNGVWGSKTSPVGTVRYYGFGGRYRLDYQWRLA